MNRAIGGQVKHFADLETYKRVQVDYTLAAARAFVAGFGPALEKEGRKFRFVFCSGKFAEWDQSKSLSFMSDTRKVKVPPPLLTLSLSPLLIPSCYSGSC
jgi:hypothetical protein